jgi:dTDP-4-amino-4,6-dideoxygalactose transaminase
MTILSFHPVKSITTGEGGAVMTNSKRLYERLMSLRTHGVVKNSAMARRFGGWYYEMRELGFNYRITDIQAALGCSQLKRLDAFISRRREIAAADRNAFRGNPNFDIPAEERHGHSAYHLYPITLKGVCSARRKAIFESLRGRGLGVQVHYIPVHLQPYYRKRFGYGTGMFPAAESYYSRAISLPIYPSMSRADIARVIRVCKEVIHE